MTKAESSASRTHFADDETLAHIAALELEAADLREQLQGFKDGAEEDEAHILEQDALIKDLRERLAKAREDFAESAMQRCYTEAAGYGVIKDASHTGPNAYAVGYQDGCAYCAELIRALAHPKGEDHGNG